MERKRRLCRAPTSDTIMRQSGIVASRSPLGHHPVGGGTHMGITRLYTGEDGQTHIEELDLASHPELTSLMATKGVVFRSTQPGYFSDWHTAPRRQYVITLAGEAEIGLRDGSIHRLGPGDVNLAEDLTGTGHTTRVVGNVARVTATIQLAG